MEVEDVPEETERKKVAMEEEEERCPICFESISSPDAVAPMNCACTTKMHASCVMKNWLAGNQAENNAIKCPICKKEFLKTLTGQMINEEEFQRILGYFQGAVPFASKFLNSCGFALRGFGLVTISLSFLFIVYALQNFLALI